MVIKAVLVHVAHVRLQVDLDRHLVNRVCGRAHLNQKPLRADRLLELAYDKRSILCFPKFEGLMVTFIADVDHCYVC